MSSAQRRRVDLAIHPAAPSKSGRSRTGRDRSGTSSLIDHLHEPPLWHEQVQNTTAPRGAGASVSIYNALFSAVCESKTSCVPTLLAMRCGEIMARRKQPSTPDYCDPPPSQYWVHGKRHVLSTRFHVNVLLNTRRILEAASGTRQRVAFPRRTNNSNTSGPEEAREMCPILTFNSSSSPRRSRALSPCSTLPRL